MTGGIVGALVDAGTPEEHAHVYSESIRRGSTPVSAACWRPLAFPPRQSQGFAAVSLCAAQIVRFDPQTALVIQTT